MKKKKNLVFLIAMLFVAFASFSQVNKRQAILISRVGDDYFKHDEYIQALRYYQVAFDEYPEYVKAQFQMAECFRLTEQYDSASYHYKSIVMNGQDFRYPLSRYHLAMIHRQNGESDSAIVNLKAFQRLLLANDQHDHKKFRDYYQKASDEIKKMQ